MSLDRHEEFRLVKQLTTASGLRFNSIYAKMSDGKWLKRAGQTWKAAHFNKIVFSDPETKLRERRYVKMSEQEYRRWSKLTNGNGVL